MGLVEEEKARSKELMGEYWKVARHKEAVLSQKARFKWIKEGDGNTKNFHSCVN